MDKQRIKSDLESKKRGFESRKQSNQNQLDQLYRTLDSGRPLNSSEEYTKKQLEKENNDFDKQIEDIERAISQLD